MSAFCDCPLICEDPTKTFCIICGNKIPQPLTDEAADKLHLVENTLTRESVLNRGVAPEHWTDADHAKLHAAALKWVDTHATQTPDEIRDTILDLSRFHVFTIVYAKFREEYNDILKATHIESRPIHAVYDTYRMLGPVEFHKYLGEEIQFKVFCDRFYDRLRELYNVDYEGVRSEFARFRKNKQSFYQYDVELTKRQKR